MHLHLAVGENSVCNVKAGGEPGTRTATSSVLRQRNQSLTRSCIRPDQPLMSGIRIAAAADVFRRTEGQVAGCMTVHVAC
jgi:hypothetical protein